MFDAKPNKNDVKKDSEINYKIMIISKIVEGIDKNIDTILLDSFGKILLDKKISDNFPLMAPYIYAAGFLSLLGKPINEESLKKLLSATGIKPSEEHIDDLLSTGIKSRIPYMYAVYFLIILGKEVTSENIRNVSLAMGEEDNQEAIEEVLVLYKKKIIP